MSYTPEKQKPASGPVPDATHRASALRGHSNPLDALLQRLDGVQKSGNGYRARCPACGGRSRKLSVSEADNGAVLLHCFASCDALNVMQAVGMTLADLFPVRLAPQTEQERRSALRSARLSQWGAALEVLVVEALIVVIAARQLARWQYLSEEDDQRLAVACDRLEQAWKTLRGMRP